MFDKLTAVLLAAGDSTRLWPLGDKILLKFKGKTLIQHSLNQLIKLGLKKCVIIANSRNFSAIQSLCSVIGGIDLKILIQKNTQGMAGAILTAKDLINGELLLVNPTDVFEDYLLDDFISLYKTAPDGILVGKILKDLEPLGYYQSENNVVKAVSEKPQKVKSGDSAAIVFDYFKDGGKLIGIISKNRSKNDDLYEKVKDYLAKNGLLFKLLSYNGYWSYLKYPWHVLPISNYFLEQIKPAIKTARIDRSVKIEGNVVIDKDVTILENVKIVGPVYIGKGSLIGQNCLIRESAIGSSTVIGFSSEVVRSYLGNNCWFHHNYIGDSVVLDNSAFGFGAAVANYRLDGNTIKSEVKGQKIDTYRTKLGVIVGKNCRIGVNVSLMPGVKIGNHTFIGANCVVSDDVDDDKYMEIQAMNIRITANKAVKMGNIEANRKILKF